MSDLKDITPQEWVETLSGNGPRKYRKGRKQLRKKTVFCCLGVLADIRGCAWDLNDGETPPEAIWMEEGSLHESVMPRWLTNSDQNHLAHLNDEEAGWGNVIEYIEREIYPRVSITQ